VAILDCQTVLRARAVMEANDRCINSTTKPLPCLRRVFLDKIVHFVDCVVDADVAGRDCCNTQNPLLCFKGGRRGSTVWRQLTLLPRANRLTLADMSGLISSFRHDRFSPRATEQIRVS
jgi:hypothetical protein